MRSASAAADAGLDPSPFAYQAYGVRVLSDLLLPELSPPSHTRLADTVLRIRHHPVVLPSGAADKPACFDFSTDHSILSWQAVGRFAVSADGLTIDCDLNPGVSDDLAAFPLLGPVLSESLRRRGLLVLHASAVSLNGQAVVLLADKGTGKSTAATALVAAGGQLLSDDLVAITPDPQVLAGFGQVKLSEAARTGLTLPDATARDGVHALIDKTRLLLPADSVADRAMPLARLYVLARGTAAGAIRPLPSDQSLPMILRFSYAARFGRAVLDGSAAATHFRQSVTLAGQVKPRLLSLPEGIENLCHLPGLIAADLETSP